ncbi:MAG: AAA family ATPase [Candidatus Contendobacter sp.]|nr:AAA family ATPase [Candidatus Contendobacter sp.]
MRKKLPIGIQTFADFQADNYAYVDKTPLIARLVDEGRYYFLARPRRFGKSLLVDTLAEAFAARRERFAGLYLEQHWDWNRVFPVIRIDLGGGVLRQPEVLDATLRDQLQKHYEQLGVIRKQDEIHLVFAHLIKAMHHQFGERVVILIDEYDKPILDNLGQPDLARAMREGLRNFYSVIKGQDAHLRFVLLTGVSKFSKVSLFSGLNNLKDITLDSRYATLCGYTHEELTTVFADWLDGADVAQVRDWYNGYNFLGEAVYNPFDVLLYLDSREFRPYWFETGTPSFLFQVLERRQVTLAELDGVETDETILGSFDVDTIEPEALLFQTGYLTVQERRWEMSGYRYRLSYPNREVRLSLPRAQLQRYTPNPRQGQVARDRLAEALRRNDPEALHQALHAFFASIPHDWHRNNRLAEYEGYYASVVYCYFAALGVDVRPEEVSYRGQVDLTIRHEERVWLLEFKLDEIAGPDSALEQIKARGYHHRHVGQPVTLIGINFSRERRNISGFAWTRA